MTIEASVRGDDGNQFLAVHSCSCVGGGRAGVTPGRGGTPDSHPRLEGSAMPGREDRLALWRVGAGGGMLADPVEHMVIARMQAWHSEGVGYAGIARRSERLEERRAALIAGLASSN